MASNAGGGGGGGGKDQRLRSEQHKSNFEMLKEENLKLREVSYLEKASVH